jgi:hypothetical protein
MFWKSPALLFAAFVLVSRPMSAAPVDRDSDPVEKNLERALIAGPINSAVTISSEDQSSGYAWLQSLSLRSPDRDAAEASGVIDTLLTHYADLFGARDAWFKEATHCTQLLIEQGKSEEAMAFARRERERARRYFGDPDLGPTAASIVLHLCLLLRGANLPGCD